MTKRTRRSLPIAVLALAVAAGTPGCEKVQARAELKEGNAFYAEGSYREALASFQTGLELDPGATFAWRSVGFSAVALHRPGDHSPENERYADVAVEAFENYLRAYPDDEKIEEYLMTVLLNAERYDQAIERLKAQARGKPGQESSQAIANILLKAGRPDAAFAQAEAPGGEPDPEVFYSIGVACWDRAANDATLDTAAADEVTDLGLRATGRALELRPDYAEAMAYHNLLLRQKARFEPDPYAQQEWILQAEEWRDKAIALIAAREAEATAENEAEKPPAAPGAPGGPG
jgi:tetratricopeptide (TPR) repeat protein